MTEENNIVEFGNHTGRVIRFFNRKGYGFVHDLNTKNDYFVHNSEIKVTEGTYRKLYPGEYITYNLVERNGKQTCSDVRGIMGYPLLVENEEHTFRVYPKQENRGWNIPHDSDTDDTDDTDDNDDTIEEDIPDPVPEVINKVAPEGIEVADFEGLNINEEMG